MTRIVTRFACCAIALAPFGISGCSRDQSPPAPGASAAAEQHAHEAPHGGHLIELGNDDYHAELTHDDATHKVGVYVLDSEAKNAVPIEAASVTINLVFDSRPAQYTLVAVPQSGETGGRSSYFELVSEALCDGWDAPGATARLNITIGGKPYVGEIESHDHDHDDHSHD